MKMCFRQNQLQIAGLKGECYPDVKTAMKAAVKTASESDMIFIGGSTFIVADAIL
jgi:dihydrofolate synthase / folylpolyglutamate synthase